MHTVACNTIHLPSSQNVLGTILCLSRFWQDPVFHHKNNSPIWILTRTTQITFDWNFCFDVFLTVKKVYSVCKKKKERKREKLFPAWFLCTVNTSNIRCDSCFVKEMSKKKGSRGDWCFDLSCINTMEANISSPRASKLSALRVLAVIVSNKAV